MKSEWIGKKVRLLEKRIFEFAWDVATIEDLNVLYDFAHGYAVVIGDFTDDPADGRLHIETPSGDIWALLEDVEVVDDGRE